MTTDQKLAIIREHARKEGDVGSPEVQVAILTARITELTAHLQIHKKDHSTRRGLIAMVNRRRKLLKYLNTKSHDRYVAITKKLSLRR